MQQINFPIQGESQASWGRVKVQGVPPNRESGARKLMELGKMTKGDIIVIRIKDEVDDRLWEKFCVN